MYKVEQKEKKSLKGLDDKEVESSRALYGSNTLSRKKRKSFLRHFITNLSDPVIKILLCALGVNLFFVFRGGDPYETIGIAASVFLAAFISTLSERGGEAAFRKLSEECSKSEVRVRRNDQVLSIPIDQVVVGDLVLIGAGEQIPADCLIISGRLKVDQSPMTGESREVEKYPSGSEELSPHSPSSLLRGCTAVFGECEARVTRVGDKTMLGEISDEIQTETRESPLKLRLSKLAGQISKLGYLAAFLIAIAYIFNTFVIDSGFKPEIIAMKLSDLHYLGEHLLHAFMLGLTVIVVAVPEGLPMMIAVVLSSNIKRMIRDKVLVRKPDGIEAAGSMNILFTDKTGTLTEGKLGVERLICADLSSYSSPYELFRVSRILGETYAESCRLNTSASMSEGRAIGGNATDRALLLSASALPNTTPHIIVNKVLFDSAKKYSSASLEDGRTFIKGAPEKLLPKIRYYMDKDGRLRDFSSLSREFIKAVNSLCARGERVLLTAFSTTCSVGIPDGLCLIAAVHLRDRVRPEAGAAVNKLKKAGIQVVMITGDNKDTAEAIARSCGIIDSERNVVLTSDDLSRISDDKLSELLPRLSVVARALPKDKSRLVKAAQASGLVCGMTGDGINDAPALRRADIGFAMGEGTQVAKDASDIIIADGNLSSICKAVLYGRSIFKSIRKFITLQLTMNFCAVAVSMICPFIGIDAPVTVIQMLWINIIMDTLGGLAFAGEAPLDSYMNEPPKRRDEPILNRYMINQILFLGGATVALCLAFLKLPSMTSHFRTAEDNIYLLTAFFALFIFSSVFNCFNSRTDRLRITSGLSKNPAFILIMSLVSVIQILFVYLGGSLLRTAPLSLSELIFTLLISLLVFPAEFLRKLLLRLFGKRSGF